MSQPAGPLGSPAEMSALFKEMREDAKQERAEHKAEVASLQKALETLDAGAGTAAEGEKLEFFLETEEQKALEMEEQIALETELQVRTHPPHSPG